MPTPVEVWAPGFLENCSQPLVQLQATAKFPVKYLEKLDNVIRFDPWTRTVQCHLCETAVTDRERHHQQHMKELRSYLRKRKVQKEAAQAQFEPKAALPSLPVTRTVKPKSEYYDDRLCTECGGQVERTGKRGQPPKKCLACRS